MKKECIHAQHRCFDELLDIIILTYLLTILYERIRMYDGTFILGIRQLIVFPYPID
jgi:hypothetical protein